ncbi:MAG TPA: leucyl aminopeptidase [Acidimicrobiales bacterium]|nr:leucyl aminopeptidase [Acidimicrobiales bacterium]
MPITFSASRAVPAEATVLGVPVFTGLVQGDGGVVELDTAYLGAVGFEAKAGQAHVLPADDGGVVVALGLGDEGTVTAETYRKAGAALAKAACRATDVAVVLGSSGVEPAVAGRAVAEGIGLAAYAYTALKSEATVSQIQRVTVVGARQAVLDRAAVVVEAVCFARDLVNEHAATMTPTRLAERAVEMAERTGLGVRVLDEEQIRQERMGGLLGVAQGSDEPPRFIELTYEPPNRPRGHVVLVGKGITFDSGGLSIKTADGMTTMKTDMGGAAAVIAAMSTLPALGVRTRVTAFVPATENMPSGRAVKPGDVLRARNGTTIEVLNTDAEGRLVLADGLSMAVDAAPDAIVDIATLTGAQVVALGKKVAGLMGNDDRVVEQVRAAADRVGEPVWQLPLPEEYRSHLDSEVADIKNIGNPGQAGTLVAGLFLKEFVGDVPWAHLDIAGPARADCDDAYVIKGGTGFGVRTLVEFVDSFTKR